MSRKGFIFTTDAMMAMVLIVIVATIVLFQGTTRMSDRYSFEQANFMAEDGVSVISTLKFSDVNESERDLIIAETNLTAEDLDMNLVSVIGALWAEGTPSSLGHAEDLTEEYIGALIPEGYSYGLYVNDDVIYADPINDYSVMSASRRMISGIHEGMPLKGISARLSISNILSKDTAKYLYFGGFVGEGNITKTFDLPDVIENVTNVYIEMDVGSNFTMFVNGNYAGNYTLDSPVAMFSKNWTMNAVYYPLFSPGGNVVQINFTDAQNSFIGGGYIKVGYNTSQMDTTMIRLVNGNVSERFDFSGVNGFINIYSSFYVPGTLNALGLHLHLDNPYTTYLYIGGTKVYENTTNQTQYVDLNDTTLSSMLNYGAMSGKTIPIRLGIKNMTGLGQGSDVVLITDLSGSMDGCDVSSPAGPCDCNGPAPCDRTRLNVAKEADKEFVDTILNNEGQRVGLVSYDWEIMGTTYLSSNNGSLKSVIDTYASSDWTCISCGVKGATDMLASTINVTTLANNGTAWRYNDSYMDSAPPDDSYGRKWYDINYSLESSWSNGNAVFGSGAGAIPFVTTLTAGGGGNVTYAEMWDDNRTTIPVGFESGYNATGNTFGWNTGDDGWDYDPPLDGNAPYGFDDDVDYNLVVNGLLEFDTRIPNYAAASTQNRCSNNDCSGAYGIEVNITQQMYDIISAGGTANVSFQYNWTPNPGVFEATDEVWIKARWTDRLGVVRNLGTEMSNAGGDTTPEINRSDDPDNPPIYTIYAMLNVTNWIDAPGMYYLDLGGKVYADASNEWGYFRFDDILINISNGTSTMYPYLWDDNVASIPVSFETGYYALMNTFGWNMGDDGWDYDTMNNAGPYGYDDNVDYNKAVNGKLEFDLRTPDYTSTQNRCNNYDCSGAYGVQIDITQQQYDILANNGMARVSFMYEWDDNNAEAFESADDVWIKARWADRTGTVYDLGTEQSTGGGTDTTPEIDFRSNPNSDIPQTYTVQDVTNWIDGPGTYYLDFGGKLLADGISEWGYFRFDDVLLEIRNGTEAYYFRKNFTVSDLGSVGRGFLKVASDDMADIYLNGRLIDADPGPLHSAKHWNRVELIDRSYFRQGDNVVAAKLYNSMSSARFDMRLEAFNDSRNKAMLVMSDGEANYCYPSIDNCPDTEAVQQLIDFACYAYENYGIISHAVGFGSTVDEAALQAVADCGRGMYRSSNNADELKQIYQDIANAMISYTTQRSNITGEHTITTLYPDSYIEYNYTPIANLDYGEISLSFESQTFGETSGNSSVESPKNGSYWIPPDVAVVDAKATSYSSEFWTSIVNMKNETSGWTNEYNLSTYGADFTKLGDPYIVYLPTSNIGINQTNYVAVNTGYNATAFTGGSPHGRVIYNLKIKGTSSYGEISARADGCSWTVEQYNLNNVTIKIPSDYNGTKSCEFSSAQIVYDLDDSIDNAAVLMFKQLDVTEDNRIDIAIDQTNIDMRIIKVVDLPWMWGPAILKLQVWK